MKCIEDEIPFEVPEGWEWTRLKSITQFIRNGASIKQYKDAKGFPITRIETISTGTIDRNRFGYANIFEIDKYEKYVMADYDILMSHINSPVHLGKCALYRKENNESIIHGMNLLAIRTVFPELAEVLCIVFRSKYFKDFVWDNMKQAVNQASITTTSISGLLFPTPPKEEQQRIIEMYRKINESIAEIEGKNDALKNMILLTKSKILDLAIKGHLVPQNPDDEPASVLLKRIRAEKEELIKQGKIKRDKKESVIFKGEDNSYYEKIGSNVKNINDEIPFELPDSWVWCRGYSCFEGMSSTKPQGEYFDYIDIDAIDNRLHKIKGAKHLPVSNAPSRASRSVKNGSVLFSLVRPYLENIALVEEKHSSCVASSGFYICNSNGTFLPEFMFYLMISRYVVDGLNQYMKGDNSPSISKDNIEGWLYPVPPFKEQKAICAKLQSVFALIESIEKSLS